MKKKDKKTEEAKEPETKITVKVKTVNKLIKMKEVGDNYTDIIERLLAIAKVSK